MPTLIRSDIRPPRHRTQAYLDATDNGKARGERRRQELSGILNEDNRVLDMTVLSNWDICTQTEKHRGGRAASAGIPVLQYLEAEMVGEELPGVITGFSSAGVWTRLTGIWPRDWSPGTTWVARGSARRFRSRTGQLVSSRTGSVLCIGDPVTVLLMRVDPAERDMELMLKERPTRNAREMPQPRSRPKNKRGGRAKGKSGRRRRR